MKKRTRILILGIAMMFIMAMSGCGVNHKSPEGVVEALIKNYVSGSEKKVKQCYSQEKDTNELLQNEIDATLKYFAAHNPTAGMSQLPFQVQYLLQKHMSDYPCFWFQYALLLTITHMAKYPFVLIQCIYFSFEQNLEHLA